MSIYNISNMYPRYTFITFNFTNPYIVTRGIIYIIEFDRLHQIWIHIKTSMTLDEFTYYCLKMVP
jgi:hypothetical protein